VRAPLATLILVNHNQSEDLPNAIQAIRRQDYRRLQVIIVDNGSTDESLKVIETCIEGDGRCELLQLDAYVGAMRATLAGLDLTRGSFVCFVTPDELLFANHVSVHLQAHLAVPVGVALTTAITVKVGADGAALTCEGRRPSADRISGPEDLRPPRSIPRLSTIDAETYALLINCTSVRSPALASALSPGAANMFRRYVVERVRPRVEAKIPEEALPSPYFNLLCHLAGGSADIDVPLLCSKIWAEDYRSATPDFPRTFERRRRDFDREGEMMAETLLERAHEFDERSNGRLWMALDQAFGANEHNALARYALTATRELLARHSGSLIEAMPARRLMHDLRDRMSRKHVRALLADRKTGKLSVKNRQRLWGIEVERLTRQIGRRLGLRGGES
jgi:hypothetical protein